MKKNLLYLFALICSMSLFTACSDDDEDVSPWAGTYGMAEYTTTDYDLEGTEMTNWPVTAAIYADWVAENDVSYPPVVSSLFRTIGGSIIPQVLNSITLDNNGNILADYHPNPVINMDPNSIMNIFYTNKYPSANEVKAGFPTSGFTSSPKGLATWKETNGKFVVKLNIPAIITAATGTDASGMGGTIEQVLSGDPALVKALLKTLSGIDFSGVQDATIAQLQGWVKDGIPMNIKKADNGHTYIYLDKSAFNNLMTLRKVDGEDTNDLLQLWYALSAAGMIPDDAQMAVILVATFGGYWSDTTTFNIGLDLVKK